MGRPRSCDCGACEDAAGAARTREQERMAGFLVEVRAALLEARRELPDESPSRTVVESLLARLGGVSRSNGTFIDV